MLSSIYLSGFVQDCYDYFNSNLDSNVTLQMLAASLGFSKWAFVRKFKRVFGKPPSEFLWALRLNYSHLVLLHGDYKQISDVCYGVGFKSLAHFSRRYKKKFGVSPSESLKIKGSQDFPEYCLSEIFGIAFENTRVESKLPLNKIS